MASADDIANLELIESLVVELHEGSISQPDMERLNGLLLGSPDGRRLFLQYAHIEAGLHWIYDAREQVATVIDGANSGAVRPIADIAQQQLRFADDARFIQVMQACSANESHSQDWLQIFPRVHAMTSLCIPSGADAVEPVQAFVDKLLAAYAPEMSLSDFWAAANDATRDVLHDAAAGDSSLRRVAEALRTCAFASLGSHSPLDAVSIHEILDDCIPHRLPADTLRVLCLRYLNGLSLNRIALHLNRSAQHVQAHLAKVRVHLVSRCLAGAGADVKQLNISELLRWSALFDAPTHDSFLRMSGGSFAAKGDFNPTHLLLLGMVHDYLGRQLSATRLLDEVPSQKNKSYLHAIEQSLRDIETLGTTQPAPAKSPMPGKGFSQRSLHLAALLGVAAGLLIAVGISMLGGSPDVANVVPVNEEPKERADDRDNSARPPATEELASDPAPPMMPVVAVISEAIGISSRDRDRFAVGSEVRMQDAISFEQGILELSTTAGCELVFEGPLDALIADQNRIALRRGKVTGLNENEGESLIIDSPTSSIVDVGTEFGVAVDELKETTVAVYDGEVLLESLNASSDQTPNESMELKAGWETKIDPTTAAPSPAIPLSHDREFVRTDEVQLRKDAERGNLDSAAKVGYFDLLRIKGLLCYQGFHEASSGAEYSLGFRDPSIRRQGEATFGSNVVATGGRLGHSHSLGMGKDATCYLDIDASAQSRLARTDLVDENGLIGNRPGELWLCWRTKAVGPPDATFSWAGLSLMFGDNRSVDEPLFVGQPAPLSLFGIHAHQGKGEPREVHRALDKDGTEPGEQPRSPDFDEHLWLVRLSMNGTTADVAVWCDVQPGKVADFSPEAMQTIEEFRFDRIRLEAHPDGEAGQWLFDDIIVASSSDAIAETLRLVSQDAAQPPREHAVR